MNTSSSTAVVTSPCIKLCAIDERTKTCRGCRRTLSEIATWSRMSDQERRAVLSDLPHRTP